MSGIATAVVAGSVVSGYMSSQSAKKAANRAASAEERAAQMQIDESSRQFDKIRELLSPYTNAGESAIGQQQALLGLSGADAQQAAINALPAPQFKWAIRSALGDGFGGAEVWRDRQPTTTGRIVVQALVHLAQSS